MTGLLSDNANSTRIDTHIHVLTPSFVKALDDSGGDPSGWPTPTWSLKECISFSDTVGSSFSVLSVTAPGPALLGPTEAGRNLARKLNEEVWEVCCQRKGRFGFFASLPDFNDIEGTLEEIRCIFETEKKANGVVVMTSYGDRLVGDEHFKDIWKALDHYKALVFVHPGHVKITPEKIGGFLPQPVLDYPQATTRAVMSLIISGTVTMCPNIDIILSHAGGTFPYIGQRAIGSLAEPTLAKKSRVNIVQAQHAVSRFYYDLALSTSTPQLKALLAFTSPSKILFGSDFPYAPRVGIYGGLLQYSKFAAGEEGKSIRPARLNENATTLLQKHKAEHSILPVALEYGQQKEPEFGLESSQDAEQAREQLANLKD
ncbi:2-amino-3-carboxymuconate-6-semialdehyde decarboxylase [Hypoxylon crocopeplum]|nr:2-amino-3-carboxymuconate-6-semialdehyde decarboxylase [Hypoxylon crocopeplum]